MSFLPDLTSTITEFHEPTHPPRQLLTPIPNTHGEFLFVIDNSSLEKLTTCPRSAEYYLLHGREGQVKSSALVFGGAAHVGLESFLRGESVEDQNAAVANFFLTHPAPSGDYRTLPVCLEVLEHYRKRSVLPDYYWEIQSHNGKPIIEVPFELPLGVLEINSHIDMPWLDITEEKTEWVRVNEQGKTVYSPFVKRIHIAWSGRIDLIATCGEPFIPRVCDHKTTSVMSEYIIQEYRLSNPMLGYNWAANELFPELGISGGCINFLHLARPSKSHVGSVASPGPKGGQPPLNLLRTFFDYSPERIAQWKHNTLNIVSDFFAHLIRNYFPMYTKWCFGKFGACPYHEVCRQDDPTTRLALLHSPMYKQVTWNPTADR